MEKQEVSSSRIVAHYDYVDESGAQLYQVLRKEPKGFAQRRPDGRGGWLYNLKDVRRVLYNLPNVLKGSVIMGVHAGVYRCARRAKRRAGG